MAKRTEEELNTFYKPFPCIIHIGGKAYCQPRTGILAFTTASAGISIIEPGNINSLI